MMFWQRFFLTLIILLTASLLLVGCVRPVPEPEVATPAEPDASDPEVGGGTINDPTPPPVTVTAVTSEIDPYPAAVTEAAPIVETATATPETAAQPAASTATPTPAVMATKSSAETAVPLPPSAAADCPKTHVVQPGENLFRIGLQYGLSWVTLAHYNGITNPNNIITGQTIQIPCADASPPPPSPTPDIITYYIVQPGDNLFRIGLKFGVSWVEIAEANGFVNPNQIVAGQTIKIPTSAPGPRPEFTHIVKQGETIYSISVQYGIPAQALADANNLQSPYVIYPGQTLVIPGAG